MPRHIRRRATILVLALLPLVPLIVGAEGDCYPVPIDPFCAPAEGVCDLIDNDCNGLTDEGLDRLCAGVGCDIAWERCIDGQWTPCECVPADLIITAVTPVGAVGNCPPPSFDIELSNVGGTTATLDKPRLVSGGTYVYVPDYTPYYPEYIDIPAGGSYTVRATARLPAGYTEPIEVLLTADPDNSVPEGDETNNTWTELVPVPPPVDPPPDLIVTDAYFNPDPAQMTDRISVRVNMQNVGAGTAYICTGIHEWRVSPVDAPFGGGGGVATSVRVLAPGDTFFGGVYVFDPGELDPGTYTFNAAVDPNDGIEESDESNNDFLFSLTIEPPVGTPDLVITNITPTSIVGPCPPGAFDVEITNVGDGLASVDKPKLVRGDPYVSVPDSTPGYPEYIEIPAGGSYVVRATARIPYPMPGPLPILFTADYDDVLSEADETNNEMLVTVNPGSPPATAPDLVVTSVEFNPNPATTADRISIRVNMQNVGAGTAYFCNGVTEWRASETSGAPYGGGGVATTPRVVDPGATFFGGVYIIDPYDLPAGSYEFEGTTDPNDGVEETDETNNSNLGTLVIQ